MKASDNKFPKLVITEGATPVIPDTGDQKLFIDSSDHKLKRVNASGSVVEIEASGSSGGGGSGSLLAAKICTHPGDAGPWTTSSASLVDVDATNAEITFTAPASGNVLIHISGSWWNSGANWTILGLREATTNIDGPVNALFGNFFMQGAMDFYLTGVSAGSHTYKLAFAAGAGTANIAYTPLIISVFAAP